MESFKHFKSVAEGLWKRTLRRTKRDVEQRVEWCVEYASVECGKCVFSTNSECLCFCEAHERLDARFQKALARIQKLDFVKLAPLVSINNSLSGFDVEKTFVATTCEGASAFEIDSEPRFALVRIRWQEEPNDDASQPFDVYQLQARLFDTAAERDAYARKREIESDPESDPESNTESDTESDYCIFGSKVVS